MFHFASRPPSAGWEALTLPEAPGWPVWVWYKPAEAPDGLLLQVPPPTLQACGPLINVARLVAAAGIPVELVATWTLQGMTYESWQGQNPLLTQPIPLMSPQGETVLVRLLPAAMLPAAMMPGAPYPAQAQSVPLPFNSTLPSDAIVGETSSIYDAIEADWLAVLQMETQLSLVRKQLGGLQGRLQSLNRDLTPEERVQSDNNDKRDWQDVRRWLREALSHVARHIRDHDIGSTSAAGNRNRFEQMYEEIIKPRRPVEGLSSIMKEFEAHRKTLQSLLIQMQTAHSNAARDGEQRAQQVLTRIAAKVRAAKTKK